MSTAFEEIYAGLNEAINHAKGEPTKMIEHTPSSIDVKAIRAKTGMDRERFCATFGISLGTLRHWERGLRTPKGTALVLLRIVDKNPTAVIEVLAR